MTRWPKNNMHREVRDANYDKCWKNNTNTDQNMGKIILILIKTWEVSARYTAAKIQSSRPCYCFGHCTCLNSGGGDCNCQQIQLSELP